ncbi:hypothetical protein [Undibacterium sp. YM2]|jgi:hypothetical protein|uniref:hypothetical protein n=1 Tax=Undibacterium sp. YM2 TaxID=2058625 RepID=UPI00138978DF|nr:hypothetical protein [Undibacterium sp. YM2]
MPLNIKFFFTLAITVIAVLIYFSGSGKGSAGPDWWWTLGRHDRVRQMLFRPDGSARRYMKISALSLFAIVLLILWVFVPTI